MNTHKSEKTAAERSGKQHKLTLRIPAVLITAITIVVAIMCLCFNLLAKNVVSGQLQKQIDYVADQNAKTAVSYLENMNVYAQALASEVLHYQNFGREAAEPSIIQTLEDAVSSGRVFSAYFAFEPNAFFEGTPDGLSYYAYQDNNRIGLDILNDYVVYKDGDYYATTKKTLLPHITEPYKYELSSGETVWLITLSMPIIDSSGKFLGAVNCDIESISLSVLDYSNGDYTSAHSTILTSYGTFVANTGDNSTVGSATESADFTEILDAVQIGETVTKTIQNPYSNNQTALAVYKPITISGTDLMWISSFVVNQNEAYGAVTHIVLVLLAIGVAGILVLSLLCFWIIRKSLAPIRPVMQLAEKMGRYDLSEESEKFSFPDNELGELASIFTNMADDLKEVIADESYLLSQMAAGDFTVQSRCENRYVGALRNILMPIQEIGAVLGDTLREINTSSDRVAEDADQVSGGAQTLAQGATEQASAIEELSAMINSISDGIGENAKSAEKASELSQMSSHSVMESNQYMTELTKAMEHIAETSKEIQKINTVIDNIAFQTNILSLNAAVEAARAGEAGRGFAVVADEVRNLAQKSTEAAKSTAALIQTSVSAVAQGNEIANQTATSLQEVAEKSQKTNEIILAISAASEKQATAVEQVRVGIDQIATVVQVNSATSEESAAASHELSGHAQNLKKLVGVFRLPSARGK